MQGEHPNTVLVDELTETTARNLTEAEKKSKIQELQSQESEIKDGLANPKSIIHSMVFESEKSFFLRWASTLKQLHYLGIYQKPINTIQEHIQKQVGKMDALSADKRESIRTHLYKILPNEFREQQDSVNFSQDNTSAFLTSENSFLIRAFEIFIQYHRQMIAAAEPFVKHLQDPEIHADFVKIQAWDDFALFCSTLEELIKPIKELSENAEILDEQLADHSSVKSLEESVNIRAMVDTFRNAMRLLLISDVSYRKDAHKFGISPRQHQRNRTRDAKWPEKDNKTVIRQVLGSYLCPGCHIDLITKQQYFGNLSDEFFIQYKFKDKKFAIPDQYKNKGLNPFQIAEKVWGKSLKLVPIQ